jgi:hypothetical protein
MALKTKKLKYGNTKCEYNGMKFDSLAELRRYKMLELLQKSGKIIDLTRQISFVLAPKVMINGSVKRSLIYRADFSYRYAGSEKLIVEDVKGILTAVYKIKRHLMMSVHGIEILETK